jgi:flagellar hook-associated protein 2
MLEREVDLWEDKAKTGMLYRDDILNSLTGQMRRMIYQGVEYERSATVTIGGKTMYTSKTISLFDIGITTSNASGNVGKLVIDERKLTQALEDNLDRVNTLFNKRPEDVNGDVMPGANVKERNARMPFEGIADRLNDIIDNMIAFEGAIYKRAGLEETSSIANNDLYKLIDAEDAKIKAMMQTLYKKENDYYMMFSRLETAMTQANNQMDTMYALLGYYQ